MEPYNKLLIPLPFGLNNTGVICYFNSFLQLLCGCSSFTKIVLTNNNYLSTTRTGVAIFDYVKLYSELSINHSATADLSLSTKKILLALCLDLKERRPNILFGRGQESAHEVFILLLDMMESNSETSEDPIITSIKSPITKLFLHKSMWNLYCKDCKNIVSKKVDYGVIFDMHHIDHIDYEHSPEGFSSLIRQHASIVTDYKCEFCQKKSETVRIYDLRKIPEIVFCSFNVYQEFGGKKYCRYFPPYLLFPAIEEGKKHKFILIGQIEHCGSLSGGHYWAKTLRKHNDDIIPYELNDMGISISEFKSTSNTYIILYHYSQTI